MSDPNEKVDKRLALAEMIAHRIYESERLNAGGSRAGTILAEALPQSPRIGDRRPQPEARGAKPSEDQLLQIRIDKLWVEPANPEAGQAFTVHWSGEALADLPARKDRVAIGTMETSSIFWHQELTSQQVETPKGPVRGQARFDGLRQRSLRYWAFVDINVEGSANNSLTSGFGRTESRMSFRVAEDNGCARPAESAWSDTGSPLIWTTDERTAFRQALSLLEELNDNLQFLTLAGTTRPGMTDEPMLRRLAAANAGEDAPEEWIGFEELATPAQKLMAMDRAQRPTVIRGEPRPMAKDRGGKSGADNPHQLSLFSKEAATLLIDSARLLTTVNFFDPDVGRNSKIKMGLAGSLSALSDWHATMTWDVSWGDPIHERWRKLVAEVAGDLREYPSLLMARGIATRLIRRTPDIVALQQISAHDSSDADVYLSLSEHLTVDGPQKFTEAAPSDPSETGGGSPLPMPPMWSKDRIVREVVEVVVNRNFKLSEEDIQGWKSLLVLNQRSVLRLAEIIDMVRDMKGSPLGNNYNEAKDINDEAKNYNKLGRYVLRDREDNSLDDDAIREELTRYSVELRFHAERIHPEARDSYVFTFQSFGRRWAEAMEGFLGDVTHSFESKEPHAGMFFRPLATSLIRVLPTAVHIIRSFDEGVRNEGPEPPLPFYRRDRDHPYIRPRTADSTARPVPQSPWVVGNAPEPQPQIPTVSGNQPLQIRLDKLWVEPANPDPGQPFAVHWRGQALADLPARKDRVAIWGVDDTLVCEQTIECVESPKGQVRGQARFDGLPAANQYWVLIDLNLEGITGSFLTPGFRRTEARIFFFVGQPGHPAKGSWGPVTREDMTVFEATQRLIGSLANNIVSRDSVDMVIEAAGLLASLTTLDPDVGRNSRLKVELARVAKRLLDWQAALSWADIHSGDPIHGQWRELLRELVSASPKPWDSDAPVVSAQFDQASFRSIAVRLIRITPDIVALRPTPVRDWAFDRTVGLVDAIIHKLQDSRVIDKEDALTLAAAIDALKDVRDVEAGGPGSADRPVMKPAMKEELARLSLSLRDLVGDLPAKASGKSEHAQPEEPARGDSPAYGRVPLAAQRAARAVYEAFSDVGSRDFVGAGHSFAALRLAEKLLETGPQILLLVGSATKTDTKKKADQEAKNILADLQYDTPSAG